MKEIVRRVTLFFFFKKKKKKKRGHEERLTKLSQTPSVTLEHNARHEQRRGPME